jgi:hypothetical protein
MVGVPTLDAYVATTFAITAQGLIYPAGAGIILTQYMAYREMNRSMEDADKNLTSKASLQASRSKELEQEQAWSPRAWNIFMTEYSGYDESST